MDATFASRSAFDCGGADRTPFRSRFLSSLPDFLSQRFPADASQAPKGELPARTLWPIECSIAAPTGLGTSNAIKMVLNPTETIFRDETREMWRVYFDM